MKLFTGFNLAVVVDVETTGLDPQTDRIVSVVLIRANFASLQENPSGMYARTWDVLINPQCRIPKKATSIHGITNKDVADEKTFSEIAQDIRDFIGYEPVIAHNVALYKRFLNAEFKRAGVKTLSRNKSFCTKQRFRESIHFRHLNSSLYNVVEVMGAETHKGEMPEAVKDASLTLQVAGLFYLIDNGFMMYRGNIRSSSKKIDHDNFDEAMNLPNETPTPEIKLSDETPTPEIKLSDETPTPEIKLSDETPTPEIKLSDASKSKATKFWIIIIVIALLLLYFG